MLASLEQHHLAPTLGQPVREHGPGRAAADDHDVGGDLLSIDLVRLVDVEDGPLDRQALHRLRVALALRERDVAGRRRRARVGVVADDRELLRGDQHRLHRPADPSGQPALDHVADEASLDEGEAALRRHQCEGGPQPEQRIDRQRREGQLRLPLLVGGEGVEVVVDPGGHLLGSELLVRADHQHLRHRHRGGVLVGPEILQRVATDARLVEVHRERDGDEERCGSGPDQQLQCGAEVGSEGPAEGPGDAVVIAEREHPEQSDDDQDVSDDDQPGGPAVLPDVSCGEEAENEEDAVLGERVGDERELGRAEDAEHGIDQRLREEGDGEDAEEQLQPALGGCQLGRLHLLVSPRRIVRPPAPRALPAPRRAPLRGRSTRGRGCTSLPRSGRPG